MIVVAGEALVDVIARRDGEIVAVPGGGPYTTARTIGRLGVPVAWAGVLSSDAHGRAMTEALLADGVSLDLVQRTHLPTTQAFAELDERGEARYRFVVDATSAPSLDGGRLLRDLPRDVTALHVGTLGLAFEPMASAIEALVGAVGGGTLVLVDPNCRPSAIADPGSYRARLRRVIARADVVKLSTADLAFLGADVEAPVVVVTDAGSPVRVRVDGAERAIDVPPVEVVDTVGAGDTFGGALLAWLVQAGVTRATLADEAAILDAVGFAIRASAIVCRRVGADPPTLAELGGWGA